MIPLIQKAEAAFCSTTDTANPKTIKDIFSNFSGAVADKGLCSIYQIAGQVGTLLVNFSLVLVSIMVLYSAFLYVSSLGEEAKAETAKKTLIWSIVGFVVIGLAKTISVIMANTIK